MKQVSSFNYVFPLLSALFSAGMLMFSEVLTTQYRYSSLFLMIFLNGIGGFLIFLFLPDKIKNTKLVLSAHPFLLLCASLFSYCFSGLAAFYATSHLGATKISFALQLESLFIVVFAVLFLKEKLSLKTILAGILILAGGFFLQYTPGGLSFAFIDFIALLAPFFFAIGILLNTRLLQEYSAVTITAVGQLLVALPLIFLLFFFNNPLTFFTFFLIVIMSCFEGLAWLFYNKGLETVGASATTILFGSVPFFTLLFSYLFNHFLEDFFMIPANIFFVVCGGILISTGIIVISQLNP
jgi:drug/metabolite transporter (DMT)-like permease